MSEPTNDGALGLRGSVDQPSGECLYEKGTTRLFRQTWPVRLTCCALVVAVMFAIVYVGFFGGLWCVARFAKQKEQCVLRLEGRSSIIVFAPDGQTLAGQWNGTLKLWDVATGLELRTFRGHTIGVGSVAFSPDGKMLASASRSDQTARLWNVATGKELATLKGRGNVRCVAFSGDGSMLAWTDGDEVGLWDVVAKTEVAFLRGHTHDVRVVAFAGVGRTLAAGTGHGLVRLWDVTACQKLSDLGTDLGFVNCLVFSPDGRTLAAACSDTTIRIWDLESGNERTIPKGHAARMHCVSFSPDGKMLASAGSYWDKNWARMRLEYPEVKLWDVVTGKECASLRPREWELDKSEACRSVAFSPDGKTLATVINDRVEFWPVKSITGNCE